MNNEESRSLLEGLAQGHTPSLARLISWVENLDPRIPAVLEEVHPQTKDAYRIGITGPPGAGKSTLIASLALKIRQQDNPVAVLAVDPSSPFRRGALLGDRIRMTELSEDPRVFIRSMASRGSLGGLAAATWDTLDLLDCGGYDPLVVETIGVGQVELDVVQAVDTVVVVLVPESGDSVQTLKAGLMEIADVFVVNKADREGAHRMCRDIEAMLDLSENPWRPTVVRCVATTGEGIDDILSAIESHKQHAVDSGSVRERRKAAARGRILRAAENELLRNVEAQQDVLPDLVEKVVSREMTPGKAARSLLNALKEQR